MACTALSDLTSEFAGALGIPIKQLHSLELKLEYDSIVNVTAVYYPSHEQLDALQVIIIKKYKLVPAKVKDDSIKP